MHNIWRTHLPCFPRCWGPRNAAQRDAAVRAAGGRFADRLSAPDVAQLLARVLLALVLDVIQRLTDLGQDASGLATELQGVLAQRLARRICSSCKVEAAPDPALVAELFPDERVPTITSYRGRGCSRCRGTGTSGRTAVLEFLPIDDALRDAISRGEPTADLRRVALQGDMVTLRERALELVRDGVVPLADLPRILSHHRLAPER